MTLYEKLVAAGVEVGHHESDLYAVVCPESAAILKESGVEASLTFVRRPSASARRASKTVGGLKFSAFTGLDGRWWYEIPFAYDKFWKKSEEEK
jgi:hypothetical protein